VNRPALVAVSLAALLCSCKNEANQAAKARIWGNEKPPTEVERLASQTLAVDRLDSDAEARARVLGMRFDEVRARLGFVHVDGKATLEIGAAPRSLKVTEKTTIDTGTNGDFRMVQEDGKDEPMREVVYHHGVFYVRNGRGQMRVQGVVEHQHTRSLEEGWQPLSTFAAYFGPRLGLKPAGDQEVSGRACVAYDFVLLDGPDLIKNNDVDAPKRPKSVSGRILVDRETGVPMQARLRGSLEAPAKKEGREPGQISVAVDFTLKRIEGKEIKPKDYVPTIKHRPTDTDPLAFMQGDVRTSTVIGGKARDAGTKPAAPAPEPGDEADGEADGE
jgi:hypothetical protein